MFDFSFPGASWPSPKLGQQDTKSVSPLRVEYNRGLSLLRFLFLVGSRLARLENIVREIKATNSEFARPFRTTEEITYFLRCFMLTLICSALYEGHSLHLSVNSWAAQVMSKRLLAVHVRSNMEKVAHMTYDLSYRLQYRRRMR